MTWERLRPFVRCHNIRFGATELNPGQGLGGRFHPFQSSRGGVSKAPLPLYSGRGFHKVRSAAEQAGILIFD